MSHKSYTGPLSTWGIPAIYAVVGVVAAPARVNEFETSGLGI